MQPDMTTIHFPNTPLEARPVCALPNNRARVPLRKRLAIWLYADLEIDLKSAQLAKYRAEQELSKAVDRCEELADMVADIRGDLATERELRRVSNSDLRLTEGRFRTLQEHVSKCDARALTITEENKRLRRENRDLRDSKTKLLRHRRLEAGA